MFKYNNYFLLFLISLCLISCYIESDGNNPNTEKSSIILNIPLTDEIMKAPSNTYYFVVNIYKEEGGKQVLAYNKEYVVGNTDVLDVSANGGIFPIIINDLEEGTYTELILTYKYNTIEHLYGSHYDPFTITEGENTTIAINMFMG